MCFDILTKPLMTELPSKYSSRGLSEYEAHQIITTGRPMKNRPIGAIKIEDKVNDVLNCNNNNYNDSDDIQMIEVDDEQEVSIIADYVTDERSNSYLDYSIKDFADLEDEYIDYDNLVPEIKPIKKTLLVVDTNFMLSHLNIIDSLAKLHSKYHHEIIIPITVMKELDGLKSSNRPSKDDYIISGTTVGHLARWANAWIYSKLADLDSSVRAQKLRQFIDRDAIKDDAILDCCVYFQEKENALVILLSNDKNLCLKALANDVLTVSYRKDMTASLIASKAFQENQLQSKQHHQEIAKSNDLMDVEFSQNAPVDISTGSPVTITLANTPTNPTANNNSHLLSISDFHEASSLIYREVQLVVLNAIDYCMYDEYGDDLELIGYDKTKVTRLEDSSNVLIRFYVSVFTEYFQKSSFQPFERNKKRPVFISTPSNGQELVQFVNYWSNVLTALYIKRNEDQSQALEKIIERWNYIANPFSTPH